MADPPAEPDREEERHRGQQQIEFDDSGDRPGNPVRGPRRTSTSAEQGLDLLADERTKEVLDKIGATIGDPNLRIVVVGKTGVGKTTLINGLFEENIQAHISTQPTEKVDDRTLNIASPSGNPVAVMLTDTPGTEALVGVGKKANRREYVKSVSDAIKKADIILFCLRMDDYVREQDVETMQFFLKEFGDRIWAKVIIVLTCANKVIVEIPEEYKKQVFDDKFVGMQRDLQRAMKQAGIAEAMAKATAVSAAGSPWSKCLPGCDDWACPFLVNCLKSGITDNSKAALLHSTWKRWATATRRGVTGTAGGAGVATGLGLMVVGGVMSSNFVTIALGVPLAAVGTCITIYSASASVTHAIRTERKRSQDLEIANRIQNLQPGDGAGTHP